MRGETMVASLVGASDTFKLVTTEGAARLSRQSRERKALIANMVTAASEEQSRPTGAVVRLPDAKRTEALLRYAELEAEAQEKLAEWLKRAGSRMGGH